jgi:hypothetical protein
MKEGEKQKRYESLSPGIFWHMDMREKEKKDIKNEVDKWWPVYNILVWDTKLKQYNKNNQIKWEGLVLMNVFKIKIEILFKATSNFIFAYLHR